MANARPEHRAPETLVALCVRAALGGEMALARGRRWTALAALEEARDLLMTLYAQAHGGERPMQSFERTADARLQAELARAVATWEPASIHAALLAVCDLLDGRLDAFSGGVAQLSAGERATLERIRARLTGAISGDPAGGAQEEEDRA